ncbi:MAG TPA: outer membrane protein assembly factor BamE [Devosiaceae bacterium]|jgi:outer membrane protein assembly factor BamE (lipoprotein component of BamABCDE complex)|nr:outer membrane protein assembly factor BamE [Devosiaceae bacterium]
MPLHSASRRLFSVATALVLVGSLAACSSSGLALTTKRTEGYAIPQEALAQVREGQSKELVTLVLGSPQTQNAFANESAYYYVETKVEETAFGLDVKRQRTVLAVYFDSNDRVKDKAVYGSEDGRVFAIESRRTPSFGEDRTFIESILSSF